MCLEPVTSDEVLANQAAKMAGLDRHCQAILLYSKALDVRRRNAMKPDMQWLNARCECFRKTDQLELALADARSMIDLDETCAAGYLVAGKILRLMDNHAEAAAVFEQGLVRVSQHQAVQRVHGTVSDPLRRLPPEVTRLILSYLTFRQVVRVQLVCRSWRRMVLDSPELYSSLDFRACRKESVTPELLQSCIKQSKGGVEQIFLSNLTPLCSAISLAIILNPSLPVSAIGPDGTGFPEALQDSGTGDDAGAESPSKLRYLYIDQSVKIMFNNWQTLGEASWRRMSTLQVFRIHAKVFQDVVQMMLRHILPNLRILDCYYDSRDCGRCRSISNLSIPNPGTELFRPLPSLEVFNFGGLPAATAGEHGLTGKKGASVYVGHREFDYFLQALPNLRRFSCVDVYATSRALDGHYFERTDFRHNAKLEEIVIIGSWLERMPTLAPSCKTLVIRNSSMTPRTVISSGSQIRYDSSFIGEDRAVVVDEYANLQTLDLSGCEMLIDSKLIATLARCDASRLTSLNLSKCLGLVFCSPSHGADLMAKIVERCPSLKRLNVSDNNSVNDFVLLEIRKLPSLEFLDISRSSVHNFGVLTLLSGLFLGACSKEDLTNDSQIMQTAITQNRDLWLAGSSSAHPMRLAELVMNGCQGVTDDMCWWIADLGIKLECKLLTEVNRRKRRRDRSDARVGRVEE